MKRLRLRRPSPPLVISIIALFVAMGGTTLAVSLPRNSVGSAQLRKGAVKRSKIARRAVSTKQLSKKATIANADKLDNMDSTEFVPGLKVKRFFTKIPFGQAQDLFQEGVLKFRAACIQNGTNNGGAAGRDIARILVSTTQNGAAFEGADTKRGTNAGDFLDTGTPEADRVFSENHVPTGTPEFDSGENEGFAVGPDGTAVAMPESAVGFGNGVFGANCLFTGYAVVTSG